MDNDGDTALIHANQPSRRLPIIYPNGSLDHQSVVETLLEAGADINAKNNDGMTALISASIYDYLSIVETLLQAGADKNAYDNIVSTALLWAVVSHHQSIVGVILPRKAPGSNEL
jgi:ankyrin repeat protein